MQFRIKSTRNVASLSMTSREGRERVVISNGFRMGRIPSKLILLESLNSEEITWSIFSKTDAHFS